VGTFCYVASAQWHARHWGVPGEGEGRNLEEQQCEEDIKQNISSNGNNINFSVLGKFYTNVHGIKTGHSIIPEDLGFDSIFASGRFEISKIIGI